MEYKLSELFDLQMGKTPSRDVPEYWSSFDYPWISISDLSSSGKYISKTKEGISERAKLESSIKVIPAGTVVMSFKLSIGKVAITSREMYSNEAIMAFIDKGIIGIVPDYLYYLLMSKEWDIGTNKAVMGKTLNKATLSDTVVNVHQIDEQRHIISCLDKTVNTIVIHKKQLAKLDELIKARFVELFGEPEYNNKCLPIQTLDRLCTIGSSKRIYQNEQSPSGVPFWRVSDLVSKMDTGISNSSLFISEDKYMELKEAGLVPTTGDILITSRGTLGRCYIIKDEDLFYFQDGMISWLSNYDDSITPTYLQYLFIMPGFTKQIDNMQAGSTVAYLSITMLKRLQIMVPNKDTQIKFASFVTQVEKSKAAVQSALNKAQLLFDSLMQKYFG